jgi:hypothetical protein
MYSPERIDNTQALADATCTARLVTHLRRRVRGGVDGMRAVFEGLDAVSPRVLLGGPAAAERAWGGGHASLDLSANASALVTAWSVCVLLSVFGGDAMPLGCAHRVHPPARPPPPQDGSGALPVRQFEAGCAALGVVLSAREREWAERAAGACGGGGGELDYRAFCDALLEGDE